ncbi:MAG: LysE family translocator [Kiritimatiellae bacterium]|nr:LysE family translocator [Kiritimatiellia bacterium]
MRLWLYLGSCFLMVFAPGPDNCFVLAQSAAFGAPAGLAVTAGLASGLLVHITLAVLGAAVLLEKFPRVADLISLLGAFYLLWVAWGMWQSGLSQQTAEQQSLAGFYLKGVILNLSNPKVILFFLAFLPRFLPEKCTHRSAYLCLLGVIFIGCVLVGMGTIALLGGSFSTYLQATPQAARYLSCGAAIAVAAIAGWILWEYLRNTLKMVRSKKV